MSTTIEQKLAEIVECQEHIDAEFRRKDALYNELAKLIDTKQVDAQARSGDKPVFQFGQYAIIVDPQFTMTASLRYKVQRTNPLPTMLTLEHNPYPPCAAHASEPVAVEMEPAPPAEIPF